MTTTFVDQNTVVTAAWLNSVDAIITANAISALQPLSPSSNKFAYYTGSSSAALADISDFWIALLGTADAGAFTSTLDTQLAAIAALTPTGPIQIPYFTAVDTAALLSLSSDMLALLGSADYSTALTNLGFSTFFKTLIGAADQSAINALLAFLPLAGGTMSGNIAMGNNDVTGANNLSFNGIYDNGNSGSSKTINFSTNGQYQKITMTGNCTFTFTAPPGPCVLHLDIYQDGTGSRVMTLPASVKWPSTYLSADKLLTTAASSRDLLLLRYDGTNYIANLLPGIA
jgi:hypothetical protein